MSDRSFHRDNHYVPCLYLKRFASSPGRIFTYQTLVAHDNVRLWKQNSIRGVAYHSDLYTRLTTGGETDEIERWLDREFEAPAEEALERATSDAKLTPHHWSRLIRYAAAQDVRTPARLLESIARWDKVLPKVMEDALQELVDKLKRKKATGEPIQQSPPDAFQAYMPIRVTTEDCPKEDFVGLKTRMVAGRGLWLWSMQHVLTRTLTALNQHRWTILHAPDGLHWFTSDAPVIRLNYQSATSYTFGGGWGSKGTEILLPLSPRHLLYTRVGTRPPERGTVATVDQAKSIRRFIAEHAYRMIFSAAEDEDVTILRPRVVDARLNKAEKDHWRRWNDEQTRAERELMSTA